MQTFTLRVHTTPIAKVDVRQAADFTIVDGSLYVWDGEVNDNIPADETAHPHPSLIAVFAPGGWTHAEWLGR